MANQGVLRDVIKFFADHAAPGAVVRTQLVKLVFLADLASWIARRRPLTGVEYVTDKLGPFSWDISDTAGTMQKQGIAVTPARNAYGNLEYRYMSETPAENYDNLSQEDLDILQDIWLGYGHYGAGLLVEQVHSMEFVRMFDQGDAVDFRLAFVSAKDKARLARWKGLRPEGRVEHSPNEAAEFEYALHRMKYGEEEAVPLP